MTTVIGTIDSFKSKSRPKAQENSNSRTVFFYEVRVSRSRQDLILLFAVQRNLWDAVVTILSPGQTIITFRRNIPQHCWAQHVACVWPPCCDMLRVGNRTSAHALAQHCCINLAKRLQHHDHFQIWADNTQHVATPQQVATWWPNACNMLRPTMLQYVTLKCCDRLAGALV